ncbi:MAG TPA: alpha/beta hydrolase family protein [Polyangiaceae bacterium]
MKRRGGLAGQLLARAAAGLDRAVTLAVRAASPGPEDEPSLGIGHESRMLALRGMLARYAELPLERFFPEPRAIEPSLRERGSLGGLARTDVAWPSLDETFLPELHEAYRRTLENHVAVARLLTRGTPRPVAVLIHGYLLGRPSVEERVWPIQKLSSLGFDVALLMLPFHAARADPQRAGRPEFPSSDPRIASEGFRQVVTELRELVRWLRGRGHPLAGVMGMSLGGYTAALAATVTAELDFVVPIIPLASLPDFALEHGDLPEAPEPRALEHALLEEAYRTVSPLAREPLVPGDRMLIVGARADRITPLRHARRLSAHFHAPLVTFPGGHLFQLGRGEAFASVAELLTNVRSRTA